MRTMRAVLLDRALGFTIRVPSTLVSEVMARVEGHPDQRSDDRSSTLLGSNAIAINNLLQTLDTGEFSSVFCPSYMMPVDMYCRFR